MNKKILDTITKMLIINLGAATQLTLGKQGTHLEAYPRGYSILNW